MAVLMIPDKLEMDQKLVREWLTEYKALPGSGMPAFARKISSNVELLKALFHVLNSSSSVYQDSVCSQLYEFYRSGHHELKRFCIQFVPLLVWQYLRSIAMQETIGRIESLLLGIYNLEVVEADGTPKAETFTIPTLARPSIFHEPMSPLSLSDNLLLSHQNDHTVLTRGPLPQISTVNAQNRGSILCHVLSQYNADIGFLSPLSLQSMCAAYSRLALTGFSNSIPGHPSSSSSSKGQRSKGADLHLNLHNHPRIPLSPNILLEMMTGVYFAMFNGHATAATQALEDIHFRASYELYAEVLLVTNAIKNSLETNPSGRPSDGPVGINIAVTPASPVVKRAAITNASFKNRRNKDTPTTTTTTITVMIEGVEKGDRRLPRSAEKIIVRKTNSDHVTDDLRSPHNRGTQEFHENGTEPDEAHPLLKQRTSRSLEALELKNISNSTLATNGKSVEHSPYSDTHSTRTSPSSTFTTYGRSPSKENLHRSEDNLRSEDLSPTEKTGLMDGLRVTYSGVNGAQNSNSNSSSAGGSRNSVSYETTL